MSDLAPFSSWFDIYQLLRARAETARGTVSITASGGDPAVSYPHTTSRDAFAIALVFDTAINDSGSRGLLHRWLLESDLLAGEPDDSTAPYVGNRSLWDVLATAAAELDDVHALLPDVSLIDDAMRELDTPRPEAAQQLRNAARTMFVTVLTESSWTAMALRQAEFFLQLRGAEGMGLPPIPKTLNADVIALANYWTEQLARVGEHASDTYHRLVYSSWRQAVQQVRLYARTSAPDAQYILNADFWERLLVLATQSDACNAAPAPWAFNLPASPTHPRNADPVNLQALIDPQAKTADDAARMQRDAFSQLRGEDRVENRLVSRVPRTTIDDVRRLALYWTNALVDSGVANFADISAKHVLDRWWDAMTAVNRIPKTADPNAVYEHNLEFWEAVMTIAIQVAVTREAPSRLDLAKDVAKDWWHSLKQDILEKPLLYGSMALGGLAALYLLVRGGRGGGAP
jgi:hypothetical protein